MQTAIVQHASKVLGELEDDQPESVEGVRRLLAPIDNFRARMGSGGGAVAEDEEDDDDDEAADGAVES